MRCRDVHDQLDAYLRGELAPSVRETIERHLRACEACRQQRTQLHRLEQTLRSVPAPPVPEGFAARVVLRARREREAVPNADWLPVGHRASGRLGRVLRRCAGLSAALAAGLLIGGYLGFDTWEQDGRPLAIGASGPPGQSALRQLVDPGGESLAEAYLTLISNVDG